jgi:hypothetical protein
MRGLQVNGISVVALVARPRFGDDETTTGFDFETVGERGMVGASDTVVKKFEFGSACSSNYPEVVPFNHGTIQ